MPVSAVAQNVDDLKKIFKDIDKLVKKTGFANVAYSDTGMKVEDFTFSSESPEGYLGKGGCQA